MDRGERRRRTEIKSLRSRKTHMRIVHPDGVPDCTCELSRFYFAKRKSLGCHCSKKTKGNPKYGNGICYILERPSVRMRREFSRLVHLYQVGLEDDIYLKGTQRR